MFDKSLAFKVKKILEKNIGKNFKIKEIERKIRLRKHKHRDLVHTLYALVREGEIELKGKRYRAKKIGREEILVGIFDARSLAKNRSYAFVITEKEDIYVASEDTSTAYHGDKVEIIVKHTGSRKKSGVINKILERERENFVGNVETYKGKHYLVPDNTRIHTNFIIDNLKGAEAGKKVEIRIKHWGNRDLYTLPVGEVVDVLGDAGEPEIEILSVIKHYQLPLEFPDKVMQEASNLSEEKYEKELSKRIDKRYLRSITIDPVSARDFDDSIAVERNGEAGFILYVHIADVAHFVKPDSALFEEAEKRGNSYYFPKKVIPMLPEKLSNRICSLRPLEDKLTMTVETGFDRSFNIIGQKFYESVINSQARLNYEEVDRLFAGSEHDIPEEICRDLLLMRDISRNLQKRRIKRGYIDLDLPETEFIFNDEGYIEMLKRSSGTESHQLIENFMLLANQYIAGILSKGATIYRIHEFPEEDKIRALEDVLGYYGLKLELDKGLHRGLQEVLDAMPDPAYHRVFDRMILRSLKRAKYTTVNSGHFGLAIENYTHFTSPIRRLCDLVVHSQLKSLIHEREDSFDSIRLKGLAEQATRRENLADESERAVEIKNKHNFMKKRLGEEFSGIIVGIHSSSLLVEIDDFPVTGKIEVNSLKDDYYVFYERHRRLVGKRHGRVFKLTDRVKVMVSVVSDDIYFRLI